MLALAAVLVLLAGLAAPWPAEAAGVEVTFSAAISLKEAMEELGRTFARRHPGLTVRWNFGASGELQKQIEAGAPVDLFASAATRQMDELQARGAVVAATRRTFARNALVVVVPAESPIVLRAASDLLGDGVKRVVIGNPRTVPVGQYAEESLRALGLWERLRPRLVLAENVRQTLTYVARGEVDAGIVYATDARVGRTAVRVAWWLPEDSYSPALAPVAVVTGARHPAVAREFIELLVSEEGQAVLARLGFLPPPAAPGPPPRAGAPVPLPGAR